MAHTAARTDSVAFWFWAEAEAAATAAVTVAAATVAAARDAPETVYGDVKIESVAC